MFGLPGLVCSLNASLSVDGPPLEIYGPVGLRQFVRVALNLARSQLDYSYVVHELLCDIHPGEYDGKVRCCAVYIQSRGSAKGEGVQ